MFNKPSAGVYFSMPWILTVHLKLVSRNHGIEITLAILGEVKSGQFY